MMTTYNYDSCKHLLWYYLNLCSWSIACKVRKLKNSYEVLQNWL